MSVKASEMKPGRRVIHVVELALNWTYGDEGQVCTSDQLVLGSGVRRVGHVGSGQQG